MNYTEVQLSGRDLYWKVTDQVAIKTFGKHAFTKEIASKCEFNRRKE